MTDQERLRALAKQWRNGQADERPQDDPYYEGVYDARHECAEQLEAALAAPTGTELVAACNKWEDDYRDGNGPTLAAFVRSRIEQATAGAYEACRLKMLTLNDEFWSAVAAKDCVELIPEDAKRALAQAVAKARLESAKKVIAHAPGRLPQAVQDYIAELERQLAEVKGAKGSRDDESYN